MVAHIDQQGTAGQALAHPIRSEEATYGELEVEDAALAIPTCATSRPRPRAIPTPAAAVVRVRVLIVDILGLLTIARDPRIADKQSLAPTAGRRQHP